MKDATTIVKVKDPVCGMDIGKTATTGHTEHSGQTYCFCGSRCKEKFDKHPEQYLGASASTSESGHTCCG